MKKNMFIMAVGYIAIAIIVVFEFMGHMPGNGNRENKNFEETVVNYVSSRLVNGEKVEFSSKYLCEDYKENDEVHFSANVIYYVVLKNGTKEKHIVHVISNEDKDRIIEWKEIKNDQLDK